MSILERTKSRVVERAVPANDGKEIGVRLEHGGRILVRWGCDSRSFTPERLQQVIEEIELLVEYADDVWLHTTDSNNKSCYCQVNDDVLYANSAMTLHTHANWTELKRVLRKMTK